MALFGRVTLLSLFIYSLAVSFWRDAADWFFRCAKTAIRGLERMFEATPSDMDRYYDFGIIPITALLLIMAAFLLLALVVNLLRRK